MDFPKAVASRRERAANVVVVKVFLKFCTARESNDGQPFDWMYQTLMPK